MTKYLIPEWRAAWRLITMRMAAGAVVFGLLPPDQQSAMLAMIHVPPERVPVALGVLFIVGRLKSQP